MKAQAQTKHTIKFVNLAKQRFDNFSEAKKQEIFLCIKEAKARGLLRKQPRDRCLSEYINIANYLLRIQSSAEFGQVLAQDLDYLYVYIALVSVNCITVTA
jgi:hypothetical protein